MTKQETAPFLLREDALAYLGMKQTAFQGYCVALGIGSTRFPPVRGAWYCREDLDLIQAYRREPWRKEEFMGMVKFPLEKGKRESEVETVRPV